MSAIRKRQLLFFQGILTLLLLVVSCNEKTEDNDDEIVVTPAMVAVKEFHLQKNDSVLAKLDSVFFTIDLKNGVIFNADSLPKGTKVTKLVPSITFANTMTKADLIYTTTNGTDSTVNYLETTTDSINFTYPVKLEVTAQDNLNKFTYYIKVNVHTQEPDSLIWDKLSTSSLPSRFDNPVAQKTVYMGKTAYCLVEENNGEYTLSTCNELNEGIWDKEDISFRFTPNIDSFTSADQSFFILSQEGELFVTDEDMEWISTGQYWLNVLGGFNDSILGLAYDNDTLMHVMYPEKVGYQPTPVESNFPITGFSKLGVIENLWTDSPFAIFAGGKTSEGELTSAVWAFDGVAWGVINNSDLPALERPMMAKYVVFRNTFIPFTQRELDVWLLFGGMKSDGEINRNVYMTFDNGVHWVLAPEMMQFPEIVPLLENADLIVAGYNLSADLADAWTMQQSRKTDLWTRSSFTIEGTEITWVCPYIYIFGGYLEDATLSTTIWRGVLARLMFTPNV